MHDCIIFRMDVCMDTCFTRPSSLCTSLLAWRFRGLWGPRAGVSCHPSTGVALIIRQMLRKELTNR